MYVYNFRRKIDLVNIKPLTKMRQYALYVYTVCVYTYNAYGNCAIMKLMDLDRKTERVSFLKSNYKKLA